MKRLTLLAFAAACAPHGTAPTPTAQHTLVAIFAHPDDETFVSPALAHYARAGNRVWVIIATDGRKGASQRFGVPAGDSLAAIRAGEARCSARQLGAQPTILLGFEDAGLAVLSPWPGEPLDRMSKLIDSTLHVLRPDAVITWGPEGGYGHQDHRLVGDVVTQVFQSGSVPAGTRLYYGGYPSDRAAAAQRAFGQRVYPTDAALLTTRIAYDADDRAAARRALSCHRSQESDEEMTRTFGVFEQLWNGEVAFQQWRGGPTTSKFF
jgi:LmbE family N-acetylglucosaminyl deacetylase